MDAILCFPTVTPFNPYDGSLRITDKEVPEFSTFLRNRNLRRVRVEVSRNPLYIYELERLLVISSSRRIRVDDLSFEELFRHPDDIQRSVLLQPLREVLSRCSVRYYMGQLDKSFFIPDTMEILNTSVPDNDAFQPLKKVIANGRHHLRFLCVNLKVSSIDIEQLLPLNGFKGWPPSLLLPDVYTRHISKAVDVAKVLLPTDRGMFGSLFFPRYKGKAAQIIQELIDSKIKVSGGLFFPSTSIPYTTEEQDVLEFLAKNTLGAKCGIVWGKYNEGHKGTVYDMDSWW